MSITNRAKSKAENQFHNTSGDGTALSLSDVHVLNIKQAQVANKNINNMLVSSSNKKLYGKRKKYIFSFQKKEKYQQI